MSELFLVRHGETDWNSAHRFLGWTDRPLNRRGRRQAVALTGVLSVWEFQRVVSSDLRRATETARLAGFEPAVDPAWRELDFGDLEGLVWDEIDPSTQRALVAFDGFVPPGGEPVAMFRERVIAAADGLGPGRHLVFTHGGVIRLLRRLCGAEGFPGYSELTRVDWGARRLL